jgi:hypothetical protein
VDKGLLGCCGPLPGCFFRRMLLSVVRVSRSRKASSEPAIECRLGCPEHASLQLPSPALQPFNLLGCTQLNPKGTTTAAPAQIDTRHHCPLQHDKRGAVQVLRERSVHERRALPLCALLQCCGEHGAH